MESEKFNPIVLGSIENRFSSYSKQVCIMADYYDLNNIWTYGVELIIW